MGKRHHRRRATRPDALRPDVHAAAANVVRRQRGASSFADRWQQLQRRKVGQWGALYATGAWGFLQGLGYLTELFGWPHELPRVVALALLAGLPEVLVVAWFHGDRGDQRVTGTELGLITLLFLLGGGLFWSYQHEGDAVAAEPEGHSQRATQKLDDDRRPVVAVLPFEIRSNEPADAYFVDGVQDDLLTRLTKVSTLRVVARTSVAPFRGSNQSTRQIAAALGATVLVEGGVQRSGDRVRVTVQLVDGLSAVHLWAETYDRPLSSNNSLDVQSELAAVVSDAVHEVLAGRSAVRRVAVSGGVDAALANGAGKLAVLDSES